MLDRRTLPDGPAALVSTTFEDAGFLAAFTERTGGVSRGMFHSLNLGLATEDEPEHVFENRRRVIGAFGFDQVAALRQVHGSTLVDVEPGTVWERFDGRRRDVPRGDALSTSSPSLGLVVLTADCVPVALADPASGTIAAVHAGWRGVAAGILDEALAVFSDPARVLAAVGPAVGVDHYEVGDEVVGAVDTATRGSAVVRRGGPRPHLDLPGTIVRTLEARGVASVEWSGDCTACQPDRFFSHRRDGPTGRQGLIAAKLS
jgi:YfiH family protein